MTDFFYDKDLFVHAVVNHWRTAPLSPVDFALCAFAEKLTHHQHSISPQDLAALRSHGLDDRAIHDAVQVIGYFNYITRVADALGVEPEDFITPWGSEREKQFAEREKQFAEREKQFAEREK